MTEPASGQGSGRMPWLRRLWAFMRGQRRDLVLAVAAAGAGSVLAAAVPVLQQHIVDDAVLAHRAPLLPWLSAFVLLAAGIFAAKKICLSRQARVTANVQLLFREALHERAQRLDPGSRQDLSTGQIISRVNSDTGALVRVLTTLPQVGGGLLFTVFGLAMMLTIAPILAACTTLVVPAMIYVTRRTRAGQIRATAAAQQRQGDLAQTAEQGIAGVRVVKGFGQEERELRQFGAESERLFAARVRAVREQARGQSLLAAIPTFGQVVVLMVGGWLALRHQITIGAFLAFSSYLAMLVAPAGLLAGLVTSVNRARVSAVRIFDVLDSRPAVTDRPGARPLPPGPGETVFDDVTFGYAEGRPVLDGFHLRLAPGEVVALTGGSGSGKSTAAALPARLHDVWRGAVRIDGADVRDVTLESLRRQIGMAFEDAFLFAGTIRENITYGRPGATDAEVAAAAAAARLDEFVATLPAGYDTPVAERGVGLSGGQRQRVALARALLTDPRVLVLDDVTSAVDPVLEADLAETLAEAVRGRTTLIVTRRPALLALADRVVLLEHGAITEQGTHDDLWRRSEHYRDLIAGTDPGETPAPTGDTPPVRTGATEPPAAAPAPAAPAPVGPAPVGPAPAAPAPEPVPPVVVPPAAVGGRWATGLLRSQRGGLVAVFLLVALGAVSGVAGPYLARNGIDRGMLSGSFRALAVAGGLFAVSALIQYAGTRALLVVAGRVGQRIVHTLRVRVWAHLQRLPIDFFESHRTGDLLTVVVSDVETLSEVLSTGLASIVVATVTSVVALAVMASLNLVMAGVTLGVLVPLVGVVVVCQRLSAASYRRARRRIAEMNTDLEESLSGARESQAFGQQGRRQAKFSEAARGYADARIAAYRLVAIYFPLIDLLSDIGIALLLGVGALLVAGGSLAPGELVAFVLYQAVLFTPIQQAFGFFDSLQQARVSTGRIGALLGTPPDAPAALADDRPRPAGGAAGELRLENVGFRYPDADADALTGLDLTVRPGETLAVVGASGAGKSTLVKLIARFYDPTSGRLLLGGADLRSLDPSAYRSRLGYVPQEPFLFPVSVRANIAYGRPDAAEADVVAAATAVGAHEPITALPGGYDHVVTDGSLSAGQRQLVCLARALLVDPELLLLDEATAGLDETMMGAVARAAAGRTTVMVTHRLRSARDADRVAVLADGRLAELGSHEELLAAGGRYAGMWETARSDTPATAHDPNPDPVPS